MIVVCAIKSAKCGEHGYKYFFFEIESVKTTSMEHVSKGVIDKHKEHYVRC